MRYNAWYHWIFSIALAAMAYGFALSGGNFSVLVIAQGSVFLTATLGFLFRGYARFRRGNIVLLCALSVVMISTVLFNTGNYSQASVPLQFALAHITGIIGMLFALQWAATNLVAQTVLRNLAFLLAPLVMLAIAVSLQSSGFTSRQSPFGIHPNWWGELGFALTGCALALPHWKARALPLALAVVLFVLVQSRGALIAAVSGTTIYLLLSTRLQRLFNPSQLALTSFLLISIGVLFLIYQYQSIEAWLVLRDEVLLWNDPYRGVDSGLTGRLGGWQEAFEIFIEKPVLGNGIDTLSDVHNGFLRLAGEGGLILLLTIAALIGTGLRHALRARNYLPVSIILGYVVYAMTYPRMLNMNLAAVVFYLSVFPWKRDSGARLSQHPEPAQLVHQSGFHPRTPDRLEVGR